MKILLIGPDLEENLSIGYLASSLEQSNYESFLLSYNGETDIDKVLSWLPEFDIVGTSLTYQTKAKEYFRLAQLIKGIAYLANDEVIFTEPRQKIEEMDILPYPQRNKKAYILADVPTTYMLGSRGCLNSCSYCCITTLHRYAPPWTKPSAFLPDYFINDAGPNPV